MRGNAPWRSFAIALVDPVCVVRSGGRSRPPPDDQVGPRTCGRTRACRRGRRGHPASTPGGGRDLIALPLVDGFAASMPVVGVAALRADADVLAVVPDRTLSVQGDGTGASRTSDYVEAVRADVAAASGLNGQGVTVALLDTGVAPVDDLDGRVVNVTDDVTGQVSACELLRGSRMCGRVRSRHLPRGHHRWERQSVGR